MKVLKVGIEYMRLVGLFTGTENDSTNNFMKSIRCYLLLMCYILFCIVFGGLYFYQNLDDLTKSINGVVTVGCGTVDLVVYVSFGFGMGTTKAICREIQSIVDQG